MSKTISANVKGTDLARFIQALAVNKGNAFAAAQYAEEKWPSSPATFLTLRAFVGPHTTSDAIAKFGIATELVSLLAQSSVVEKLKARMFGTPFKAATPVESTSPVASWVDEAGAKPTVAATLGSATTDLTKIAVISVITEELARNSSPKAEAAITKLLTNAIGYGIDREFLTSGVAAVANFRPASVTNGLSQITTSGTTSAAIQTDLNLMIEALSTFRDAVWIMRQKTWSYIQGHNDNNLVANGLLLGLPVFITQGGPSQITLLDLASILISDEGGVSIDVSTDTALEMSDTPLAETSPITGAILKSLWQNDLIAVRAERQISWIRTLSTAVQYMVTAY